MAKNRKSRNYGALFGTAEELPSAQDVNKQVAKLTDRNTEISVSKSNRGRKPLQVKRVPYTTSITEEHKFKLKFHAMKNGVRPSDMLHVILEEFFLDNKE